MWLIIDGCLTPGATPPSLQGMMHPKELMSLVVGRQVGDWGDMEKVRGGGREGGEGRGGEERRGESLQL